MKNITKILCLILALTCIAGFFTACTNPPPTPGGESGSDGDDGTPAETPVETPEETEPPKEDIVITSAYAVVRPETCSDAVKNTAVAIRTALAEATGKSITIKEDFLFGDMKPAELEILVGLTNREESVSCADKIKYNDYMVSIEGKKLVVLAYSDEKLAEAADYVIGLFAKASNGSITLKDADQKTVRAEYMQDTVSIGGIDLRGYTIVTSKKAGSVVKGGASDLQKKIIDVCGLYLPIKGEASEETAKEILIGDTSREASTKIDSSALGKYGYAIKCDGEKIVIKTNDMDFTFMKTMSNISKEIETGKVEAKTGNIEISATPLVTSFMFSDVHNNFGMLEPTNNYGDYIVRKNVDAMIDHLLDTTGPVDVVLVGGDLMSDYHHWNKSGNWPYKYFVEYRKILVDTFKRLSKDGKVSYVAGNHDYAQGELSTDGPGNNGSYNSCDFYFGDAGMRQDWGELPEEDMFVKVGEKTGEKYLLAYYYEVNGVGFVGLSADHDAIWSVQGSGFDDECLAWLDKKLDEVDPNGNKVIIVNCHYFFDHRTKIEEDGTNKYASVEYDRKALTPVYLGHKNLYHIFGHGEVWYSDTTARYVSHHNTQGKVIDVTGKETDSTQVVQYANRDFTLVYGGHFRPDANAYSKWFEMDFVRGYAGLETFGYTHRSTCTPRVGQGLYIEVFEDRIVFTMKNIGDYEGFSTDDLITPYTVYLYK